MEMRQPPTEMNKNQNGIPFEFVRLITVREYWVRRSAGGRKTTRREGKILVLGIWHALYLFSMSQCSACTVRGLLVTRATHNTVLVTGMRMYS